MAWKKGPLPKNTYGWGGVVPFDVTTGFYFADFCGDHVKTITHKPEFNRTLQPHEVSWYDNSLELPPKEAGEPMQRIG